MNESFPRAGAGEAVGVVATHPNSVFAPEALWWLGVALHVTKGDGEALAATGIWILEEYPDSAAALRV